MAKAVARPRDPIKLARRSGRWSIEFTRLVAVDDHLMRPERCQLAATPEALRTVSPSCPPARLAEAAALMRQADDGSEPVFELLAHGWQPTGGLAHSEQPPNRRELASIVADMHGQLVLLRGLHDALLARVVAIEAALQSKAPSAPEPVPALAPLRPAPRRVPSRRDMLAVLSQSTQKPKFDLTLDALREGAPAAAVEAAVASLSTAEAAPAAAGVAEGVPGLLLPAPGDVTQCLQLLAADVSLSPLGSGRIGEPGAFYVARLVDAAELVLAVILVDPKAGAALGGALIGLPKAGRDEQAVRGLAEDTFEGLNEICNNLGGLIKRANPRSATVLTPLEPCDAAKVPWLASPRRMLGLATPEGGTLWLAAR